ncbi:ribonuclease P 40kDa subunit-domain-containing protein, partial [Fomitopsis serialis]|uniref:ribonuclease P 40kDa subunit-domain-containing protein n=1 Tax=Fomitopsis serialis TaxID=139415 RepID=UPI002007757A
LSRHVSSDLNLLCPEASHLTYSQVDVIFSSEAILENGLTALTSTYWSCSSTLARFVDYAKSFVNKFEMQSDIVAVSVLDATTEIVFSLDSRGLLTFVVDKPTYERLGIVGTPMRWSGCKDMYRVPDDPATRKVHRYGSKQQTALAALDEYHGPWRILYHLRSTATAQPLDGSVEHVVKPTVSRTAHVYVPEPALSPCPNSEDEIEDWNDDMSALFEWVAMACLGSQRLSANDRCDPYIAVYTPPSPSRLHHVTHISWRGLLSSQFTQAIIDQVLYAFSSSYSRQEFVAFSTAFAAVTIHGVSTAPVTYISPSSPLQTPIRLPRPESEDTWSLLVSSHDARKHGTCNWVLADSIGKWDSRWG